MIYQFGQFASGEVNAWSIATDHGYTLGTLWGQPRLGLRVAVASGDNDKNNPDLQTFNPLFVRGNDFTEAGLLSPINFFDVFPSIRIKPRPNWMAELGFDIHWRENLGDGIYKVGGPSGSAGSRPTRAIGTSPVSLAKSWFWARLGKRRGILRFPLPIRISSRGNSFIRTTEKTRTSARSGRPSDFRLLPITRRTRHMERQSAASAS